MMVYPHKEKPEISIQYSVREATDINIKLTTVKGKKLLEEKVQHDTAGTYMFTRRFKKRKAKGLCFVEIKTSYENVRQLVLLEWL